MEKKWAPSRTPPSSSPTSSSPVSCSPAAALPWLRRLLCPQDHTANMKPREASSKRRPKSSPARAGRAEWQGRKVRSERPQPLQKAGAGGVSPLQHPLSDHEVGDRADAGARANAGEHERALTAHLAGVAIHYLQGGAHVRRQIGLVDDQQVGTRDAGAALPRNLVAARDVDDVEGEIGQLRAEGGGQVIAA